ncbi:uncharacterized protein LOC114718398 isoform X2 [Neltuma alba]|uniref:uncharacterized protein LOC114718398 isoform X2 n=1 Tax=Neltuma alba TaxID=207710 RepID=UPI0010A2DFF4|nr:uncharacterized protein LOC114718398 isoform X2 [Prosopis alba]
MAAQEDQDSPAIIDSVARQDDVLQSTIEETQEPVRASAAEVDENSLLSSNDKIDACVLGFSPSCCDGKVEDFSREGQNMVEGVLLAEKCDNEFQSTIEEMQEAVRASAAEVDENSFASSNDEIDARVLGPGPSWCDGKLGGSSREGQNMVEGALLAKNRDAGIVSNVEGARQTCDSEKLELQKGAVDGDGMKESSFFEQRMHRFGTQDWRVLHEKAASERSFTPMVNGDSVSENALEVKKKLLLEELEAVLRPEGDLAARKLPGCKLIQEDFIIPRSLGIEVIDDTALIETVPARAIGRKTDVLGNRKSTGKDAIKEIDAKNGKRSRRKAKGAKNILGIDGKTRAEEARSPSGDRKEGAKRKYTRKEIEAVRFVNMAAQRMLWKAIYGGLDFAVANEYDNLVSSEHQKNIRLNHDSQQCLRKKKEAPAIPMCSENMDNELPQINSNENVNPMDPSCSNNLGEENRGTVSEVECYEDEDSDSDYDSIQKPAFLVDGEPNFDLGPPDDGWEYLRRVRWEAAQIPKVTIAKLDRSKLDKEQSAYMPKIPDMAKCPEHLLPSKQWENAFLTEFSELRAKLSQLDVSRVQAVNSLELTVNESGTSSVVMIEEPQHHSHESIRETTDQTTLTTEEKDTSSSCPLLSTILRMDSVARVSMLHKRIRSLEPIDAITRNDCMWLFALCATVDAPLDADSCAALRSLLRKCANLRAMKTELDDEVVMLNILAAISGRYFGQAEN